MMVAANEFLRLDATGQAELVSRGEVSASELVDAAAARLAEVNPTLNAVIHPSIDQARRVAAGRLPDGPFARSPKRAFDAGLRPDPFPDQAASLLPGLLAATRTGLTPAGDDEHEQILDLHHRSPFFLAHLRVLIDKALKSGYVLSPLAAPHHRREGLVLVRPSNKGKRNEPSPGGGRGKPSLTYKRNSAAARC